MRSGKLFRSDFRFAPSPAASPASNIFPMALRRSAPGRQYLPDGSPPQRPGRQYLPDGSPPQRPRPATNLIRRRRSSVWLAIWRTWAGFANSQHRDAALAIPNNICAHSSLLPHRNCCSDRRKSFDPSAPIAYATSVSPPNEAIAWPRRRCWMANAAAGCRWRSSCKSPSTPRNGKHLIIRQLTFEAVRGGLDLSSPSALIKVNYLVMRHLYFGSVRGDLQEGSCYASRS